MLSKSAADVLHRFVSVCHKENSFIFCVDDYAKTIGAIFISCVRRKQKCKCLSRQKGKAANMDGTLPFFQTRNHHQFYSEAEGVCSMKHKLSEYCVKRISSINLLIQLTPRNVKFVHFYSIIIIAIFCISCFSNSNDSWSGTMIPTCLFIW